MVVHSIICVVEYFNKSLYCLIRTSGQGTILSYVMCIVQECVDVTCRFPNLLSVFVWAFICLELYIQEVTEHEN